MTSLEDVERIRFLGLTFERIDMGQAVRAVQALSADKAFSYLVTPNVDHLVRLHRAHRDEGLWRSYDEAALRICDSRILHALGRLSGLELGLVPGSDLTARLVRLPEGLPDIAVIGGDATLLNELRALFPSIAWHHHAPPQGVLHDPEAQQAIIDFIERCPAKLMFMAIGSPQSELICARIARRQRAQGVALCVGASLEFLTGAKARAPVLMQRAKLEWLFRLATEPRRLWRRYLIQGPEIFRIWWRWHLSSRR